MLPPRVARFSSVMFTRRSRSDVGGQTPSARAERGETRERSNRHAAADGQKRPEVSLHSRRPECPPRPVNVTILRDPVISLTYWGGGVGEPVRPLRDDP